MLAARAERLFRRGGDQDGMLEIVIERRAGHTETRAARHRAPNARAIPSAKYSINVIGLSSAAAELEFLDSDKIDRVRREFRRQARSVPSPPQRRVPYKYCPFLLIKRIEPMIYRKRTRQHFQFLSRSYLSDFTAYVC